MNTPSNRAIEIVAVVTADEFSRFIRLPAVLQANDPLYVAPLELERRESLSAKHNPYFAHADVQFWLARQGGRDVGRISAQIDKLAPMFVEQGVGHFGLIAAIDDAAVFQALFAAAETWLIQRGCRSVMGPFNLSINEETGLLIDGFDTPPMLMMPHDPRYAAGQLESLGYTKAKDLIAYLMDITRPPSPVLKRMVARSLDRLVIRPLDRRRYDQEINTITSIFNDAWSANWGFVPYTPAEIDHLGKSLKPLLDPKLVPIAEWDGVPVGFGVLLPNLNEAIRDLGGKLLPFNWAKLLWRLKVADVKTGRVPLMGIRRSFATGLGSSVVPFLLIGAMRARALERGYRDIELSWILEDNLRMRKVLESIGGVAYKTYRVYSKPLAAPA